MQGKGYVKPRLWIQLILGAHLLLAPTVNTQRSPLGGRGFESFAEDPTLNGTLAASYIKGVQERNVGATIKHYVANDQEFERFSIDSKLLPADFCADDEAASLKEHYEKSI